MFWSITPWWNHISHPLYHLFASGIQYTATYLKRKHLQLDLELSHSAFPYGSIQPGFELLNLWSVNFLSQKSTGTWNITSHFIRTFKPKTSHSFKWYVFLRGVRLSLLGQSMEGHSPNKKMKKVMSKQKVYVMTNWTL